MEGINEVMESSGAPTGGQGKLLFLTYVIHLGILQQPLQDLLSIPLQSAIHKHFWDPVIISDQFLR
jgi:hypothetical protein